MFLILSLDFEHLSAKSEMRKESFNEHHSGEVFRFTSFIFLEGMKKVFHYAWLHFGETHKTLFLPWRLIETGLLHNCFRDAVSTRTWNSINWQFMINTRAIKFHECCHRKAKCEKKKFECVFGEKNFDFIIYHVLLGLNVYTKK